MAADIVILFDSDWNPQVDLQAMDRYAAHTYKLVANIYIAHFRTLFDFTERIESDRRNRFKYFVLSPKVQ
jgi:SWI/SNF-related matrix-associated actin-dependent regulator of chromatin subfamily A member 5